MSITRLALPLFWTFALAIAGTAARCQSQQDLYSKYEYRIPMRDGIRLYTAVYVPKNRPGRHPILLERTGSGAGPVGPDRFRKHRGSPKFVEIGYIFADQDVRGAGQSEGRFEQQRPLLQSRRTSRDTDESTDAYDTIDYLVKNVPGNNGRVGLWGISNRGFYAAAGAVNSRVAADHHSGVASTSA